MNLAQPTQSSSVVRTGTALAAAAVAICSTLIQGSSEPVGVDSAGVVYVPDEVLVKFNADASGPLQAQLRQKRPVGELRITDTLDRLNAVYRVNQITPVFPGFAETKERIDTLGLKDPMKLSGAERRLVTRSRRAPPVAPIPALDRIFKLKLAPGVPVGAAVDDFTKDPGVEFAEPNYMLTLDVSPDDTYFKHQWALHNVGQTYLVAGGTASGILDKDVDAPEAWDAYMPGDDVVVAIVDTGVDYNHRDLGANMWTDGAGHYGHDFANDDDDPTDDHGHGTHCAGIVAAVLNNSVGVAGLCPNAKIMAVKVFDAFGYGPADLAAQAVLYAVNHGADVISNSYSYGSRSATLESAIQFAHSQGAIFVASAGNRNCWTPRFPAANDHVIAVAATDSYDIRASFSNYGTWVDLSAPGVDILSLRGSGTDMYGDGLSIIDDEYYTASGTSMSCPHVAAVASMIVSQYPALSSDEITARLLGTTDEIVGQNPYESHLLGSGRLNAHSALVDTEHPAIVYADHEIREDDNGNCAIEPGETGTLVVFLRNVWIDATNVTGTLISGDPYLNILDADSFYGDIRSGDEAGNAHDPFQVELDSAVDADRRIPLTLRITADDGYVRTMGFRLRPQISFQEGDWPGPNLGYNEPIPYDIDGDGQVELIVNNPSYFPGIETMIDIVKPDGSVVTTLGSGEERFEGIAAGDINRDGHVEIVSPHCESDDLGYNHYYLSVWSADGDQVCPRVPLAGWIPGNVSGTLADLDLDGDLEIVLAFRMPDKNHAAIEAFDWNGSTLEPQWRTIVETLDIYKVTPTSVGDIDAAECPVAQGAAACVDAGPEVVFATARTPLTDGGHLVVLNHHGGLVQGWPVALDIGVERPPALADLTGDGNLEIITNGPALGTGGGLEVRDHTGTLLWTGTGCGRSPVVGDLDADGDLEVITQREAYHHDGVHTGWEYSTLNPGGAAIGDIDGDGAREVLIGAARSNSLSAFRYDGTLVPGFPLAGGSIVWMTPVLMDLDGDGDIEVTHTGELFCVWDLPGPYDAANIDWGMYQHDPYRTGCYHCGINLPPVWFIAPEDQAFARFLVNELYVQATDPERKSVSYEIMGLPEGASCEPQGSGLRFSWLPGGGDVDQDVTFCATDADGERIEKTIRITLAACAKDIHCDDLDVCTLDRCIESECSNTPRIHGDIDGNDVVNMFDIFCILNLIAGNPLDPACSKPNADIQPCTPNGMLNVFDVFAVLEAIAGDDPCCSPGACCLPDDSCVDVDRGSDCDALEGDFAGTGTTCGTTTCPLP